MAAVLEAEEVAVVMEINEETEDQKEELLLNGFQKLAKLLIREIYYIMLDVYPIMVMNFKILI